MPLLLPSLLCLLILPLLWAGSHAGHQSTPGDDLADTVDVIAGLESGKTPYELARNHLRLSGADQQTAPATAKAHPKWPQIQLPAQEWITFTDQ